MPKPAIRRAAMNMEMFTEPACSIPPKVATAETNETDFLRSRTSVAYEDSTDPVNAPAMYTPLIAPTSWDALEAVSKPMYVLARC